MSAPIVVFLMFRLRLLFVLGLFGLPAMVRVLRFQSDRIGRQDWLRRDQPHRTQRRDDPSRHVGWHEQSPPTFSPLQASVPRCATQEGRQLHGLAVAYTDERVTSFWRCPEIRGANGGEHGYDSRRRVSRAVRCRSPRSCATALKSRTPWKHGQRFLGLARRTTHQLHVPAELGERTKPTAAQIGATAS
jgi:hypothetical protein